MTIAAAAGPGHIGRAARLVSAQHRRDILLIGGGCLVLRLAWVLVYGRVAVGPNDTIFYQIAASNLAAGRGYSELFGPPTAGWPPGFPFLVSLGYRVFGVHP